MMWAEIQKHRQTYTNAVLTALDDTGYPCSLRVAPQADVEAQVLRVALPPTLRIQGGPACLLFHSHDERLWNLKSFVVRGRLEQDGEGWLVRPEQFVPGAGIGGLRGYINFIRNGRRQTKRYLAKRNLPRPRIPWQELQAIFRQAKK